MALWRGEDNRALSPVIGVVLLVGITVLLVAVVGGFVTDFGSDVEAAPNAQLSVEFDTSTPEINVTHNGGSDLNPETLQWEYESSGGTTTVDFNEGITDPSSVDGLVQAGDEVSLGSSSSLHGGTVSSGDELRLVWTGSSGGNRQVILDEIVP